MTENIAMEKAIEQFKHCKLAEELPESLPLVDELGYCRIAPDIFADIDILFIQHLLFEPNGGFECSGQAFPAIKGGGT